MNTKLFEELGSTSSTGFDWSSPIGVAIAVVGILIGIVAVATAVIEAILFFKYHKFNHTENSAGITGLDAARKILDANGLQKIRVKAVGSFMFGNSYSHYFKKVRLRRLTKNKTSITSLAMGAEKSCLAILDKEGDKDMKFRVRVTPFIYLGPIALIPLLLVGIIIDFLIFASTSCTATIVCGSIGLIFYALSFTMSVLVLKTEKKAQERAYVVLKEQNLANDNEIEMMKELFKIYNIEYILNIIIELLELILKILQMLGKANTSTSSND